MVASRDTVERSLDVLIRHVGATKTATIAAELVDVPGNASFRRTVLALRDAAVRRAAASSAPESIARVRIQAEPLLEAVARFQLDTRAAINDGFRVRSPDETRRLFGAAQRWLAAWFAETYGIDLVFSDGFEDEGASR